MTGPLGVILAGGQASRMGGGDKTLRPLAGRRVIDHVLERLRPQVPQMALNANGDPARFAAFELPVIADSMAEFPGRSEERRVGKECRSRWSRYH